MAKPPAWHAGLHGSIPFPVNIIIIFYFHSMMSIHSFIIYILLPEFRGLWKKWRYSNSSMWLIIVIIIKKFIHFIVFPSFT